MYLTPSTESTSEYRRTAYRFSLSTTGGGGTRGVSRGGPRGGGGRGSRGGGFGRGGGRGGRGGGGAGGAGAKGGQKFVIEPHRHPGIFVARGKDDLLCTKNLTPGEGVYGEKRVSVENEGEGESGGMMTNGAGDGGAVLPAKTKTEYRVWNPFRSKLGAGILGGMDHFNIVPGNKVLYLGAASGTSVSHVSDIVGPSG